MQEEPRNNGVYPFIGAKLHYHWPGMQKLTYIGRKPSSSPAAGSHERHVHEQAEILARALNISPGGGTGKDQNMSRRDQQASEVEVREGAPIAK